MNECKKDCLSCANSFSEPAKNDDGQDILHCMEKGGQVVNDDGYCKDYN